MDANKVDAFMVANRKFFPNNKIIYIKEKLEALDDSKYNTLLSVDFKDPTTITIVSIFVGALGVDRFMIGDIGMGVLKLLTAGLCGILAVIDWFTIGNKTKELNLNNLMMLL